MSARDRYYSALSEFRDPVEAGWFEDSFGAEGPDYLLDLPITSLGKVVRQIGVSPLTGRSMEKPAILVTTGGMAPIHSGHLAMMLKAHAEVTKAGYNVVGGFIAPDHDAYINYKLGSASDHSAAMRVGLVAKVTASSGWLDVDPWAAIHVRSSVNFTDVVERLRLYVKARLGLDVSVFYVCGGDNARFAATFFREGHCCVVSRPGTEASVESAMADPLVKDNPRVLWAECDSEASSTRVRKGETGFLPPEIREGYTLPESLFVRVEPASTAPLFGPERWGEFANKMEALFIKTFSGQVFLTRTTSQMARLEKLLAGSRDKYISLDAMLPLRWNLNLSRYFGVGGYTCFGHVNRPGSPSLAEQINAIPEGKYVLFDDDTVSGGTFQRARKALAVYNRTVVGEYALTKFDGEKKEIVDLRDFAVGATDGGLVVELPDGTVGRAPYVYPFVDPTARASVPPELGMKFSASVWGLNKDIFTTQVVRDLPEPARAVYLSCGFLEESLLRDVCKYLEDLCRERS